MYAIDSYRVLSGTAAAGPATFPSVAPIAPTPARELGSIDDAAFGVFEHFFVSTGTAGPDAQGLDYASRRVDAEGAVAHAKERVAASQFPQALSDVDVPAGDAIPCAENLVLGIVAPTPATPSAELRAIDDAAFAVFEGAGASAGAVRENTQRLHLAGSGIDAEGTVAHSEGGIAARQFAESLGNVDTLATDAVIRSLYLILLAQRADGESRDED